MARARRCRRPARRARSRPRPSRSGAAQDLHQRGLARAVLAEQHVNLARRDLEVDAVEGDHAREGLADPASCEAPAESVDAIPVIGRRRPSSRRRRRRGCRAPRGSVRGRRAAAWRAALSRRSSRHAHGDLSHLQPRLVDRGQRDVAQGGERGVVVADERDVVGHLSPRSSIALSAPMAARSFAAKMAVGRGRSLEEQQRAAVAAFLGEGARNHAHELRRGAGRSWPSS